MSKPTSIFEDMKFIKDKSDETLEDQTQQDRTLPNGKVKTPAGFVEAPTSTSIQDMPGYGKEGF